MKKNNYAIARHVNLSNADKVIAEVKSIHSRKVPAISFLDVRKANLASLNYLNVEK